MPAIKRARLTERGLEKVERGRTVWDDQVPGLGFRVGAGGTCSWGFRYRRSNAQGPRVSGFYVFDRWPATDLGSARVLARVFAAKGAAGGDPQGEAAEERRAEALGHESGEGTLQGAIDLFLDFQMPALRRSPRTIDSYRRVLGRIPEADRKRSVYEIGEADVLRFRAAEVDRGRTKEAEAVAEHSKRVRAAQIARKKLPERQPRPQAGVSDGNRIVQVLGTVYQKAEDPTRGITDLALDHRTRNFSPDEVHRILKACDEYETRPKSDPEAANAVRLLLFTGSRLQEVLKARWDMFDLDARNGDNSWSKPSSSTKQKRLHRVILPEGPALEILRQMRARAPVDAVYLFPGDEDLRRLRAKAVGKTHVGGETPRRDLKRPWAFIRVHARLKPGDCRHDLRRTLATWMFRNGANLLEVGAALGHSNLSTTERYAQIAGVDVGAHMSRAAQAMADLTG